MNKINAQTLKGFRDFLPEVSRKRQYVISTLKGVFESFGFEPLETPALEYEEVLLGKYGEEGDKLMYRFTDNGERKVALRYDQTVPLSRVVAQYGNQLPIPFKRYQIQPVWRAENTQKGRFREFLQCDIDTAGTASLLADAEVIATAVAGLKALGFVDFKVLINDRKTFEGMAPETIRQIDKLKKVGEENSGLSAELLARIKAAKPTTILETIFEALDKMGVSKDNYEFSPTLARGLDYYTGLIFEIEIAGYTAGSVLGGGRYDNLVGMFSGNQVPAVGCAFGFDRIIEAMTELNLFPEDLTTTKVLVTIFSPELLNNSIKICNELRSKNINCELYLDPEAKLEKQLKYADFKKIPYAIIIGQNEAKEKKVTLKNLSQKTQEVLTLDELTSKLRS